MQPWSAEEAAGTLHIAEVDREQRIDHAQDRLERGTGPPSRARPDVAAGVHNGHRRGESVPGREAADGLLDDDSSRRKSMATGGPRDRLQG